MRADKQIFLDEIKDIIEGTDSIVLLSYSNIEANKAADFRKQMLEAEGEFRVVPKRLFVKAASEVGIAIDKEALKGHLGIVTTTADLIGVTKTLFQFAKESEDKIEILGGHVEGKQYSSSDMKALSRLPSQDQMRAEFLALLQAPMAQTLGVMDALLKSVIYCLDNKAKKEEKAS